MYNLIRVKKANKEKMVEDLVKKIIDQKLSKQIQGANQNQGAVQKDQKPEFTSQNFKDFIKDIDDQVFENAIVNLRDDVIERLQQYINNNFNKLLDKLQIICQTNSEYKDENGITLPEKLFSHFLQANLNTLKSLSESTTAKEVAKEIESINNNLDKWVLGSYKGDGLKSLLRGRVPVTEKRIIGKDKINEFLRNFNREVANLSHEKINEFKAANQEYLDFDTNNIATLKPNINKIGKLWEVWELSPEQIRIINDQRKSLDKAEILKNTPFDFLEYPLSSRVYWSEINNAKISKETADLVREVINDIEDINISNVIAKLIVSPSDDASDRLSGLIKVLKRGDEFDYDRFKKLWIEVFPENKTSIDSIIKQIQDKVIEHKSGKLSDNTLFPGHNIKFGSVPEKELVFLINEKFQLQCVPSRMKLPKPNDFLLNKSHFTIDFVVYCDKLMNYKELYEAKETNMPAPAPNIKKQIMLLGEYYGLAKSIDDIDLSDQEKFVGKKSLANSIGAYATKTAWKKSSEDFITKVIGAGTIGIDQSKSDAEKIKQVADELNKNHIIFKAADDTGAISNAALLVPDYEVGIADRYEAVIEELNTEIRVSIFQEANPGGYTRLVFGNDVSLEEYTKNFQEAFNTLFKDASNQTEEIFSGDSSDKRSRILKLLKNARVDRIKTRIQRVKELADVVRESAGTIDNKKFFQIVEAISSVNPPRVRITLDMIKSAYTKLFNLMKFGK